MLLDDYDWRGLPPDLVEWLTDTTALLNGGQYQNAQGSIPDSDTRGQVGQTIFAKDGATWYLYFYTGTDDGWKKVAMSDL